MLAGLMAAVLLTLPDAPSAAHPVITAGIVRRRKHGDQRLRQARELLRLFRGRDDHVAVAQGQGFAPEPLTEPLTAERLAEEHLAGSRCLGFYLMTPDNKVWCSCLDFDNKPDRPNPGWKKETEAVYRLLVKYDLPPLVEISQSGSAAHVWLFFKYPISARLVRAFWRGVLATLEIPVPEIYPRQDTLTGKGMGNLVRFPLWSKSHFVDVASGWKLLPPIKTMSAVFPVNAKWIKRAAARIGIDLAAEPRKQPLARCDTLLSGELLPRVKRLLEHDERLAARWGGDTDGLNDTSRSAVVMSLACMLVRRYVPTPEIEAAIRHWCSEQRYDKGDREDWVKRTLDKAYDLAAADWDQRHSGGGGSLPKPTSA
jgi:hypothetical protein